MNEIMIDVIVFYFISFLKKKTNRITYNSGTWEVGTGGSLMSS